MKSIASYFTMTNSPSPTKPAFVAKGLSEKLINIEKRLSRQLAEETFCSNGVTVVYNPLEYAAEPHQDYLSKYAHDSKQVMFVGMNPGPFGMCQNGVSLLLLSAFRVFSSGLTYLFRCRSVTSRR
jgi:hypothetical protein